MTDYQLPPEAVREMAKAIETELGRAALLEHRADREVVEEVIDLAAWQAIHAFLDAMGVTVETQPYAGYGQKSGFGEGGLPGQPAYRLVSRWFPVRGER